MKRTILLPIVTIALSAAILFGASLALSGIARENGKREHLEIMRTLLPGSENFVVEPYSGEDANIVSVHKGENGFVIETMTYGYVDNIRMLIGVSTDGKVTGLMVREMHETFGLGLNGLTDTDFLAQFLNTSGEAEVGSTVDALSGATVTSKAITRAVNSAVAYVTGADASSGATSWGG